VETLPSILARRGAPTKAAGNDFQAAGGLLEILNCKCALISNRKENNRSALIDTEDSAHRVVRACFTEREIGPAISIEILEQRLELLLRR